MRVPILKEPSLIPDRDDKSKMSTTTKCGDGSVSEGEGGP